MFQTFLHQTNFLAIIVAAVVYFVIGAVWYSVLFGKTWMENVGRTKEQLMSGSKIVYLYTVIAEFGICFVMAFVIWILGTPNFMSAIKVGAFFSVGLTATIIAINNWYGQRSVKLTLIDSGYHIVGIIFASIIMTVWN